MSAHLLQFSTKHAASRMNKRMENDALGYLTCQAYLQQQGVKIDRTLSTVTVSFPSKVAAEEFERLMKQIRRT